MCSGTGNTINLTANVTGGGGTNSFTWSNASAAATVTVATTANYYVEVEDQYTCVGKDTIDIYFQAAPQLVIEDGAPAAFSGQALTGTYASNATYLGEHENHHYYMVQNGQSWTTAKAAAEALGGYLAIPNDAAENQAIENMVSNKNVREDAWLGIYWNGTEWLDVLGNTPSYTNWWGNSNGTAQHNSYEDYPYAIKEYWGTSWYNQWKWDNRSFIIEFAPADLPVAYGQEFCDSVELKAVSLKTADEPGFDHIYWTMEDANGVVDTINDGAYFTFTEDADVTLHGVFTRSDGEECSISSVEKSIDIFATPQLNITSSQPFADICSAGAVDTITATYNVGSVSWAGGQTTDTLLISSAGTYVVTATNNLCTTVDSIVKACALYVDSANGDDLTGNGSQLAPYKTIQTAIDSAIAGQSIYVAPGTYVQNLSIDKPVRILSEFITDNDLSARANTKIKGRIESYNEFSSDRSSFWIGGFTIDLTNSYYSGIRIQNNSSVVDSEKGLYISNSDIIVPTNELALYTSNATIELEDVHFSGTSGTSSLISVNGKSANFEKTSVRVNVTSTGGYYNLISLSNSSMTFNNGIIQLKGKSQKAFNISDGAELVFTQSTLFADSLVTATGFNAYSYSSPTKVSIDGSVIGNLGGLFYYGYKDIYYSMMNGSSTASLILNVKNSVLDYSIASIDTNNVTATFNGNMHTNPELDSDGYLSQYSPAIGILPTNYVDNDVANETRPQPAGSNPDAGAKENILATPNQLLTLDNCGEFVTFNSTVAGTFELQVSTSDSSYTTSDYTTALLGDTNIVKVYQDNIVVLEDTLYAYELLNLNLQRSCYDYDITLMASSSIGGVLTVFDNSQGAMGSGSVFKYLSNTGAVDSIQYLSAGRKGYYFKASNGCEVSDTVELFSKSNNYLFVSASTGKNSNYGDIDRPLKTIERAVNIACTGDTIYVLPGTYTEELTITKPLTILSDYVRLGSTNAIANTKIKAKNGNHALFFDGQWGNNNHAHLEGFTMIGKTTNQHYGVLAARMFYGTYDSTGEYTRTLTFKNLILKSNSVQWGWSEPAAALYLEDADAHIENVVIKENNSSEVNHPNVVSIMNSNVLFRNVEFIDNFASYAVLAPRGNNEITLENVYFENNKSHEGLIRLYSWNNNVTMNHVTINETHQHSDHLLATSGNSQFTIYNSIIKSTSGTSSLWYSEDYRAKMHIENSIVEVSKINHQSNNSTQFSDNNVIYGLSQIASNGSLLSNSPAIGHGSSSILDSTGSYVVGPAIDIDGKQRPLPAGSNPDAGAFEDSLAIGDFDLSLSQCGYLITANVVNSVNYTLEWKFGGNVVQTGSQLEYLAQSKGQYSVTAISIDREDTISKIISLTNPLDFDIYQTKDVCLSNGSNSGTIRMNNWSGVTTSNSPDWWEYKLSIIDSSGSEIWTNHLDKSDQGDRGDNNFSAGKYYVQLTAYTGCSVGDSIELKAIPSNIWWLSTTGSDVNDGTETSPIATIEEAMLRACDGDTIILKDGTYYENVDLDWSSSYYPMVVIGSEYILDSNITHVSNTILDGMNDATTIAVQRTNWYGSDTIKFVGFTVQNGKSSNWPGGGGFSIRESFVALEQMIVSNNESGNNGGGIAVNNGQVSFKNTIVENNYTSGNGGGIWIEYQNEEIVALGDSGLIVRYNYSENDGGGIYYQQGLWNSQDSYGFENVKVQGNIANYTGGGIFFNTWDGNASLMLKNAIVTSNIAKNNHGGGIYVQSGGGEVEFSNLIVSQNKSNSAGGIYVYNTDLILISSTIYQNRSSSLLHAGTNSRSEL